MNNILSSVLKFLSTTFCYLLLLLVFQSCDQDKVDSDFQEFKTESQLKTPIYIPGDIYYVDVTLQLQPLTNEKLDAFYITFLELDQNTEFNDAKLVQNYIDSTDTYIYYLEKINSDSSLMVTTLLTRVSNDFVMAFGSDPVKTCSCTSSNCSNSTGCSVTTVDPCVCSMFTNGTCTKKSSATESSGVREFLTTYK